MIRKMEELSMNAWPALSTLHYDGWVLRFPDGYTKRANSTYALYSSEMDLDEKIGFCESFSRDLDLPAVFKLLPPAPPHTWTPAWKNTVIVQTHKPAYSYCI